MMRNNVSRLYADTYRHILTLSECNIESSLPALDQSFHEASDDERRQTYLDDPRSGSIVSEISRQHTD